MFADGTDDSLAVILSLSGTVLTGDERAFFKDADPLGFILFERNCETPEQLVALTGELREVLGRECPILIDQEGGRVQRLKPPVWRGYVAAQLFGAEAESDMEKALSDLRFTTLQMAEDLRGAGINVNCTPVLDVLTPETHDAIGDRAFSDKAEIVARLGLSVCRHYLASGITPVIKHMPGHGRATSDSHKDLPRVSASLEELRQDFLPFREIAAADVAPAVWGMMAHVVYEAIDSEHPASVSPKVIDEVVREQIGFDGFLLSDDLDMEALAAYGDIPARVGATIEAGCDAALYCWADLKVMEKIAESVPKINAKARQRLQKSAEYIRLAA